MPAVALPTVPLHERAVTQRFVNEQKPDPQSPSTSHFSLVASVAPSLQRRAFVGAPPPQSTSVSVPFRRPSLFAGGLQVFAPAVSHRVLSQSPSATQPSPGGHFF